MTQELFEVKHNQYTGKNTYVPFQAHSATSRAAANRVRPNVGTKERRVHDAFDGRQHGLTDKEGHKLVGMDENTYRPRRVKLVEKGLVVCTTESRDRCTVWKDIRYSTAEDREETMLYLKRLGKPVPELLRTFNHQEEL